MATKKQEASKSKTGKAATKKKGDQAAPIAEAPTENSSALAVVSVEDIPLSETYQEAVALHREIMTNAEMAAASLIAFCSGLKKMRDGKLYIELGYTSFEEYVEGAVGLKQRQAYNYIATIEKLPATILQSHAHLGITKLELLSRVPDTEREELIEDTDLQSISSRELKAKIDELTKANEQLTLQLQSQPDASQEALVEMKKKLEEVQGGLAAAQKAEAEAKAERERLSAELEAAKKAQEEAPQTSEETEKAIAEAKRKAEIFADEKIKAAEKEAKEKAVKEAEKKIEAARKAGAKEAEERFQQSLEAIEGEKAEAMKRASELEKQLKVAKDSDALSFAFYFEELQTAYNHILDVVKKLKAGGREEDAKKYVAALSKALDQLSVQLGTLV